MSDVTNSLAVALVAAPALSYAKADDGRGKCPLLIRRLTRHDHGLLDNGKLSHRRAYNPLPNLDATVDLVAAHPV